MPGELDRVAFQQAVSEWRFDEAERLLEQADPGHAEQLRGEVRIKRARAEEAARELYERVIDLAGDGDQAALFVIGSDPQTGLLLAQLPEASSKHAEAHLRAAARWGAARTKTAQRRLGEARKALEGFDVQLARGLAARIDSQFLDAQGVFALDRLLLDIESRTMELASLVEAERRLTNRSDNKRLPWWRRWRR